MVKSDVAYQIVGGGEGSPQEEEDKDKQEEEEENVETGKKEEKKTKKQRQKKRRHSQRELDDSVKEEDEEDVISDSNDADSNNNDSSTSRPNILRRTMSFLANLPRKLYIYVREVFTSPRDHSWSHVGHDDSEDSDWSSSEDGSTQRSNKHKRSTPRNHDRHRTKANKSTPPPIAPKPKKKDTNGHSVGSGSSNPPSSPDTTSPDTSPEISFDDITVESPQLKPYKRIHGPQGRRKPQRFSNQSDIRQSDIRQSEIQPDEDLL